MKEKLAIAHCSEQERRAFFAICDFLPFYSHLAVVDDRVVGADFWKLDATNKKVLEELANLPYLKNLRLSDCAISDIPSASELGLSHLTLAVHEVDSELFASVSQLKNLEYLSVYDADFDCRGLRALTGHKNLTYVSLTNGEAKNASAEAIGVFATMPRLEKLSFHALEFQQGWCERLPTSPVLKEVRFNKVPFIDAVRYSQRVPQAEISLGMNSISVSKGAISIPRDVTRAYFKTAVC